ncbi:MAG: ABC transporter permease [Dehalococcoidia bacterium]|jgi:peptide/nickel transport system permease protein|nr:ABC transporter permease [Dehalococcoidia bacterium]
MLAYIVRRLLWTPVLLLAVSAIVFALGHYGPGDPVEIQLGQHYTEEQADRLRESRGLNDPIYEQYGRYVWNAIQGDFGESFKFQGRDVAELLGPKLKVSAQLFLAASVITIGLGVPLGFYTALKQGTWLDPAIVSGSLALNAMPVFLTAPFLIMFFAIKLEWIPVAGWGGFFDTRIILPALTIGLPGVAVFTRIMRSSTLDVLGEDYVRTARAKGVHEFVVNYRHVARIALIPILTLVGFSLSGLLGGALIVELIYGVPGVGRFTLDSLFARDFPVIMAVSLIGAASLVIANLVVDILYSVVDPRIRYQ